MTEDRSGAGDLDQLIQDWIDEEMAAAPTWATTLGVDGHDHELGDFGAAAFEDRDARAHGWTVRLEAVGDDGLSPSQRINRDLVLSGLRGRLAMADWHSWRRDPSLYLDPCLSGVFILFLQAQHPLPELVDSACARLAQVPSALEAAARQLDPELLAPVIRDRAIGQCQAALRYYRELLPAEIPVEVGRARLAEAAAAAAEAFATLAAHLSSLDPRGSYAIGDERYSALLRQRELLDYGADGLHQRGRSAWAELDIRMTEVAARLGSNSWLAALEEINSRHPSTPEEMLQGYRAVTERCRQFLIEHDIVTMPEGESCAVIPSPAYQRPVLAVASYSAPPAFKPSRAGHFFVPYPPSGTSPAQIQQRLATNSYASMATIAAHEAYPGHHWHLVWSQDHASPVRSVVRTPYFSEGWALFAEQIMGEAGFFVEDSEWLCHLEARIFRAARIVVDTSLHAGDMTIEQAVEHMHAHTGLSEATARAEVGRYCAWPTQAASYLTGAMELERIRERYVAEGIGTARGFNDAVAATGSLPLGLAEQAVMAPGR
ncbi:MAG: DUF885 domain-containing protein [Acidimicrobiales bacterium]